MSQLFLDATLTDAVHALAPYDTPGRRNVVDTTDGIYASLSAAERAALTPRTTTVVGDGDAGVITLGVRVG